MSDAYISERMHRTTYELATGPHDLRTRLTEAYDNGFGTISANEMSDLSDDLGRRFEVLKSKLSKVRPDGESWSAASIEAMQDHEVVSVACEILDIEAVTRHLIEAKKEKL